MKFFWVTELRKVNWTEKCTLFIKLLTCSKCNLTLRHCTIIYRVSHELRSLLRESVPYVKLYRYNPKHLYPKLNGYWDNGRRSLKLWQLLLTYWLPNTYWNWQEYVVPVMLIAVRNIKLTCEWHKAIKLNYKNTRTRVIVVLILPSTLRRPRLICYRVTSELPYAECITLSHAGMRIGQVWRHGRRTVRRHPQKPTH